MVIDFQTSPDEYRHWRMEIIGEIANLIMDVDENGGLFNGYELKLNSYDLGVDIELYDAIQRLRFEYPSVRVVVLRSGKDRVFCAGANIKMLAASSHVHKVNFCKFTNETRNAMEDASRFSGQKYIAAVQGACAGGGYELALACDHIILTDDGSSSVSLPEIPLLGVLPGTGGLTRVTDKRKVRRDRADVLCTVEEGIKGKKAVDWGLVDQLAVNSRFEQCLTETVEQFKEMSDRPEELNSCRGIRLGALHREVQVDFLQYSSVTVDIHRESKLATISVAASDRDAPLDMEGMISEGDQYWGIRVARELDDAILHLRLNEPEIGIWQFRTQGDRKLAMAHDDFLSQHQQHWLVREILLNWARVLRRIDLTSRSLIALIEPDSCFIGTLAELAFASDRIFMADGEFEDQPGVEAGLTLGEANFGHYQMANGLSRLETRFLGEPEKLNVLRPLVGEVLNAERANELGLVTFTYDDIDWEDEIRIFIEERASFSPDAMTGMEANLRFGGPETMETKIFGRLTAWQNWIFQRPNAVGEEGALKRYGSGKKAVFDPHRT